MSGYAAGQPAHATGADPPVTLPVSSELDPSPRKASKRAAKHSGSQSGSDWERSQSEPPRPHSTSRPSLTRRYSDQNINGTEVMAITSIASNFCCCNLASFLTSHSLCQINEEGGDDGMSAPIAPASPAATEIEHPESQDIMDEIQRKGIKIRDFAYAPPYAPSSSDSNSTTTFESIPIASTSTSTARVPPTSVPRRTTELFDPYKGLTEIDYRWAQKERAYPVTGKTIRRLLDMGWLTTDELSTRGHPIDLAALQACDSHRAAAREANGGVEAFPWRPFVADGTEPPTEEERRMMLKNCGGIWKQFDRMMVSKKACEEWRRKEEEEAAQKVKEFEELERERERKKRGKRKIEEGYQKEEPHVQTPSGSKRLRLSPSENEEVIPSRGTRTRPLLPPEKQYPAPLQAYNPKLYPDAASIIQSQPPPYLPPSPTIGRTDTPPTLEDGAGALIGKTYSAQKLIHPRKQGRGLGRTQTFTELYVIFLTLSHFHTDIVIVFRTHHIMGKGFISFMHTHIVPNTTAICISYLCTYIII